MKDVTTPSMNWMLMNAPTLAILERMLLEATSYQASKKTKEMWQKSYVCAMDRLMKEQKGKESMTG